ncbi:MAG: chemotaxis protein CheW [Canidatus Methanoxibalbensis ujae]|nr:chemotaxis protein CheW [Candidatus Methanoxibalbensis ujae]
MSASSSSLSVSEDSVQRERNCEHQLVVFKLGDEEFGVDIMQVREIIKKENITVVPNAPDFVRGVINLRGQITTIIDLKRKLGISSQESTDSRQERIIVVETGNNVVGMAVDAVTEVTYLSDKDIEEVPPIIKENMQTKYLRGVGKLPDRLLILIDLKEVLNDNEREIIQ